MFLSDLLYNISTDCHKLIHPLKTLTNERLFHYFTLFGHTGASVLFLDIVRKESAIGEEQRQKHIQEDFQEMCF